MHGKFPSKHTHTAHYTSFAEQGPDGAKSVAHKIKTRPGSPISRRLRVVCGGCNGTWMSRIQETTKPILKALIGGEDLNITPDIQVQLALWATMTTMVVEFADEKTVAISREERFDFYQTPAPKPNWFVWIGKFDDDKAHGRFWHRSLSLLPPDSNAVPDKGNTQITVFSAGNLIIQTFSTSIGYSFDPVEAAISMRLALIWPLGQYHSFLKSIVHREPSLLNNILIIQSILERPIADPPAWFPADSKK